MYIRDDHAIFTEIIFLYSISVIELNGVHLASLNLVLVVIYRSSDNNIKTKDEKERNNLHRSTNREFLVYLKELKKILSSLPSPTPDIIMMGNFNLPHADWIIG